MVHSDSTPAKHAPLVSNLAPRLRLDYLDGVRALLAIYVSLFHATLCVVVRDGGSLAGLPVPLLRAINALLGGYFAVGLFIVISGYCLMIPVARGGQTRLPGGIASFLGRRARRILPPYYAAILLALLLFLLPGFNHPSGRWSDAALPAWNAEAIISHLLLVHNWSSTLYFRIDPPAWSIAVETQIYVLFAIVLLPFARRLGVLATTALALGAGAVLHAMSAGRFDYIYGSFVGLFAMGMLGAAINYSPAAAARFCRERLPWGIFASLGWAAIVTLVARFGWRPLQDSAWMVDPLFGMAAISLMIFCTRAKAFGPAAPAPLVVQLLEGRWLVAVGAMSYSYYLIHVPLLYILDATLCALELPLMPYTLLMFGLAVPFCLLGAYLFHLAFERPFMPGHPRTAGAAARAAIVAPAP